MWTLEDFEALNPIEDKQSTSFLAHLLQIAAASRKHLSDAAELLESRDGPYVVAFAQLPFLVNTEPRTFSVRGWREGVNVELRFQSTKAAFTQGGRLVQIDEIDSASSSSSEHVPPVLFTQVTGVVRLWNKRARLHAAYRNCLTPSGLRNEIIGRVENWMDAPEAKMPLPARRYAPLTAQAFQAEVARRVRTEMQRAMQSFLRGYSVANLERLPDANELFGYFLMVVPGRVACAAPPIPIASGLCSVPAGPTNVIPSSERIVSLLDKTLPLDDRVLGQLMAMHRLLRQGEPELALIGCVTAIEWFLNDRFANLVRRMRAGREFSASIAACLRTNALDFLSSDQKDGLLRLSQARNAVVHGSPPTRVGPSPRHARAEPVVNEQFVHAGLFLALEVYRSVNLWCSRRE